MRLKKQLQILADEAPQFGIPSEIMQKAVLPVIGAFAQKLRYETYYILQNRAGDWIIETLSHRNDPDLEKKVIYAFGEAQNVTQNSNIVAVAVPAAHLLFQLFALGQIDSIVFLEQPGLNDGVEIARTALQQSLQIQLKQVQNEFSVPSNLA